MAVTVTWRTAVGRSGTTTRVSSVASPVHRIAPDKLRPRTVARVSSKESPDHKTAQTSLACGIRASNKALPEHKTAQASLACGTRASSRVQPEHKTGQTSLAWGTRASSRESLHYRPEGRKPTVRPQPMLDHRGAALAAAATVLLPRLKPMSPLLLRITAVTAAPTHRKTTVAGVAAI